MLQSLLLFNFSCFFLCFKSTHELLAGNCPTSQVAYTSPIDDTACWNAQLTLSQYRAFVSAMNLKLSPFFAAAPVPTMAKFGPSLLARAPGTVETKNLGSSFGEAADEAGAFTNFSVSARAILDMDTSSGIYIVLHDGVETLREVRKSSLSLLYSKALQSHEFAKMSSKYGALPLQCYVS